MRLAVYYAPRPEDPLWQAGCGWLGRDPERQVALPQPDLPGIAALTAAPRRYGFHATLKAPMRISAPAALVERAIEVLARRLPAFPLPPLTVRVLDGFLALTATARSPALRDLADACVFSLDDWRVPDAAERARRARGLGAEERAMLERWGYPYAFGSWHFHMTLSERLPEAAEAAMREAALRHFAPALTLPRRVTEIALFREEEPGADFRLVRRFPLRGG